MKRAIVDIETNNLSANIIHCIVAHSYDGSTEKVWIGDECLQFGDWSKQIDQFIMHNGISFDAPVLNLSYTILLEREDIPLKHGEKDSNFPRELSLSLNIIVQRC